MIYNHKHFLINIHDYEPIGEIASGSFGSVFKVKNIKTEEVFAAKVLTDGYGDPMFQQLINREVGILMRLNHPCMVKFLGYSLTDFEDEQNATILMELAKNGSFHQYIVKNPVGTDNTTLQKILIGIARGMMYLHSNKILHRDLKPGNVLLDADFNAVITDFGLAKIDNKSAHTNKTGTFLFMAPEVLNDEKYNGKADVFSFGILLFVALTSTYPYKELELDDYKIAKKVANEGYKPKFTKEIKPSLKKLILQCIDSNPSKRPNFKAIFNKLAYNKCSNSVYDDLFSDNNSGDNSYYLDGVDEDIILAYTEQLLKKERSNDNNSSEEVEQLEKQIKLLKQENNAIVRKLTEQNKKLKEINQELAKANTEIKDKIDKLEKAQKKTKCSLSSSDDGIKPDDHIKPDEDDDIYIKKVPFTKNSKLYGIFNYLSIKSGGNIHNNGTVNITTNSIQYGDQQFHPKITVDIKNRTTKTKDYRSGDHGGAIVCFDFNPRKVQISKYAIESSHNDKCTCHLKNWVIEGSDNINSNYWDILDRRNDENILNGKARLGIFDLSNPNKKFYRFIRLRQTGQSYYKYHNRNRISFCQIEFFGNIQQPGPASTENLALISSADPKYLSD